MIFKWSHGVDFQRSKEQFDTPALDKADRNPYIHTWILESQNVGAKTIHMLPETYSDTQIPSRQSD